jgi:hypothetical protein
MSVRVIRQRRIVSRTNLIANPVLGIILDTTEASGDRIYQNAQQV